MIDELRQIYRRAFGLIRAVPLALMPLFAAELLQHAIEICLAMYDHGGVLSPADQHIRLTFGAIKILAIFATLLFALRWWRFDRDMVSALRRISVW